MGMAQCYQTHMHFFKCLQAQAHYPAQVQVIS